LQKGQYLDRDFVWTVSAMTPKPPEEQAVLNELLRFEIDKTHQSLFETGKSLSTAFVTYLSLVALTVLLVYGKVEDNVQLPLLSIKVSKDLAGAVTLLLSQIVQVWLISLMNLRSFLGFLLNDQLKQRFDRGSLDLWYLQYPSPFDSVQFLINAIPGKGGDFVSWLLVTAYSFMVGFVPIGLSYVIARTADFPASLKYPWLITNTVLNLSVMAGMTRAAFQLRFEQTTVRTRTRLYSEIDERKREVEEMLRKTEDNYKRIQELLANQGGDAENRVIDQNKTEGNPL
jgi:hypothetical protein